MAIFLSTNLAGLVKLEIEYNEATAVVDADGLVDADLIRFILTNTHTKPVILNIYRPNGALWRTGPVPVGVTRISAGGTVRRISDVPGWSVSMDF